jgi:hypothetical protein
MRRSVSLATAALVLAACTQAGTPSPRSAPPPRRSGGPRDPGFSGADPASRGWVRVDDLLWVEAAHADAFRRGYLWDGARYASVAESDASPKSPEDGYTLRTDHLVVRTDVGFERARALAAVGERQVREVLARFGEALDLRLPGGPIPVVVAAHRADLRRLLGQGGGAAASWGAFYRASDGAVVACDEPAEAGALPLVVDLRHELTHAVIDLGHADPARPEMFHRPHFWAWEAAAVWAEGFGDAPGARANAERFARFSARRARGETTSLAALATTRQEEFAGRHYDQLASFCAWLLDDDGGARRPGFLRLLRSVAAGRANEDDFEREIGLPLAEAERRWLGSASAR